MATLETDPWKRWYADYVADRAALKAARILARDRHRAATMMSGLLVAYMLMGGVLASIAVGLVMAN